MRTQISTLLQIVSKLLLKNKVNFRSMRNADYSDREPEHQKDVHSTTGLPRAAPLNLSSLGMAVARHTESISIQQRWEETTNQGKSQLKMSYILNE